MVNRALKVQSGKLCWLSKFQNRNISQKLGKRNHKTGAATTSTNELDEFCSFGVLFHMTA
jgi:hypothetical protein